MDVTFLQKNYLVVFLSVILAFVVTVITNLMLKQTDESKSYVKTGIVAILVSGLVIYLHTLDGISEHIIMDPVPF